MNDNQDLRLRGNAANVLCGLQCMCDSCGAHAVKGSVAASATISSALQACAALSSPL